MIATLPPDPVDHLLAGRVYPSGMDTIETIRRRRLAQLVQEIGEGNQSAFARRINRDRRLVSLWLAAPDRPGAKQLGSRVAREIEKICGKPSGWMDRSDDEATPPAASQPLTLDPEIMAMAEAGVQTIEELNGSRMTPAVRGKELVRMYMIMQARGSTPLVRETGEEGRRDVRSRTKGREG